MNARRVFTAFALAVLCSGLLTWVLSKRLAKPRAVAAVPVRQIVVAAKDALAGKPLAAAQLETMDWPAARALPGAFATQREVTGRVPLYPLSSGEPVLANDLAEPGAGTGLIASIPAGMRAISVRADEVADVSGFVMPGSSVDVLVTYPTGAAPGFASRAVLENVRVLATGQKTEPDPESKPSPTGTVTLLVSPQDAIKLAQASSVGKIALVLRNGADHAIAADEGDFLSGDRPRKLLSVGAAGAARSVPSKTNVGFTVETIAGGKETTQTFAGDTP